MFTFLAANAATILVGAAVVGVAGCIAGKLYRDWKAGKHSCGGNCAGCPSCSACHGQKK